MDGKVSAELNSAIERFLENQNTADEHIQDKNNPHEVTKEQIGLSNITNDKQATEVDFLAHTGNTDNPHRVDKTQVGLGNVLNEEQATKATYNAHIGGTADKHTADDVVYDETHSVKEFINDLSIGAGNDHSVLANLDMPNAHPITAISGLEQRIGEQEVYVFRAITTDTTEAEIFSENTGTYIDENGGLRCLLAYYWQ